MGDPKQNALNGSAAISVSVPPSKSLTQRALVLASLGPNRCTLRRVLDCDDSCVLVSALQALGTVIELGPEGLRGDVTVTSSGHFEAPQQALLIDNAGTAARFLTGLAPLVRGGYVIDGSQAMRRRPMTSLLRALEQLGVEVQQLGQPGCPPIKLVASGELLDSTNRPLVRLDSVRSSQELSALLLLGAGLASGLDIQLDGPLVSRPYIDVTLAALRDFGVTVELPSERLYRVGPDIPQATAYAVEGDWSSASFPLAAGWLTGKTVELLGVDVRSHQGDRAFAQILESLGSDEPRELDLGAQPDLVPPLAACALFARHRTRIYGVAHLRIKESDRITGLAQQLSKLGAQIAEREDGLVVTPTPLRGPAELDPLNDHRLAMAFGLVSLRVEQLRVLNPQCVSKSYPDFWPMLERFR